LVKEVISDSVGVHCFGKDPKSGNIFSTSESHGSGRGNLHTLLFSEEFAPVS
jgi:hypothetical protein